MSEAPPIHPERLPRWFRTRALLAGLGPAWRWARRTRGYARYLSRRPHDPDFAAFAHLPGDGLFLDIGASAGQSAWSFRLYKPRAPILSLEPLPEHEADLAFVKRVLRDHDFRIEGAAEHTGAATLFQPVYDRYALPAFASISREATSDRLDRLVASGLDPTRLRLREIPVRMRRLDELALAPGFVKVDVEGAEWGVLRGLAETLTSHRPVLMIEKTVHAGEWSDWLVRSFDYRVCVFDHAAGEFQPWSGAHAINLFFLPG